MAERLSASGHTALIREDFAGWMPTEQKRVFLLCYRLLQDRDEADMAAQDTFLKAYRAFPPSSAAATQERSRWITRIAVNTCLDRLRSQAWRFWRRRPGPEDESMILATRSAGGPTAEDRIYAGQIARRVAEAMKRLSPRQRAVFALKHYEDRTLEEIGDILQLDVGTVKAHMARAIGKLRDELRDLYELGRGGAPA